MSRWTTRFACASETASATSRKRRRRALDVEPPIVAIPVDVLSVDVLEHEVGLSPLGHAGIEEARDVGMHEPGEDRALPPEALPAGAADEARVEKLDRDPSFEAAVAALRQPDASHAALADGLDQRVRADRLAGERGASRRRRGRVFEEFLAGDVVVQRQQPVETLGELRIVRSQSRELGGSLGRGEIEEPIEMRLQDPPAVVFQARLSGFASRSSPRR